MAVDISLGEVIPPLTPHAVSVSLPTWSANVGYEEGQDWVIGKMKTGYPRFFIHKSIQRFAEKIVERYGMPDEKAIVVPTGTIAERCRAFFRTQAPHLDPRKVRVVDLVPAPQHADARRASPAVSAILFSKEDWPVAKAFWQHTGEGASSRRAEYCMAALDEGRLVDKKTAEDLCIRKGPRRYQRGGGSIDLARNRPRSNGNDVPTQQPNGNAEGLDSTNFVEERFGRNLEASFASNAKLAIRRRIAGSLTADVELDEALKLDKDVERTRKVAGFSEDDVYLYPTGMSAIYNTHRTLLKAKGSRKSINFGFPYVDSLKVLEKFGPGCLFYGFGSSEDLDDLEKRLKAGERYLLLFCEFPGNPLLKSPDLPRIRALADEYDFYVVVDETVGNFLNVNVLPYADVVVSSLTKIFSGDSNVMGGSAIINPNSKNFGLLKETWAIEYADNYWSEDAVFLERNSRDFVSRIERVNKNAEAIADVLQSHPRIKQVFYPKCSPTRAAYERCRNANGGYGGLLSATFYSTDDAAAFFDNLDTAKGPSLGTNFTLSSPFVILAHYTELDWAASYGVEKDLVRFSVGLEDTQELVGVFKAALAAIPQPSVDR
ncbi:pyridoxal phosphate-dependent transferase [Lineolata rhizophorae]|uniref:cystathionine gamma-synthase n=1 Tax=Lineolata rhizophorae TaxID=578093 RepID=A0A6A6P5P0_9PEZI|nr:pyridoxal phosphate-dependent transferase [Lineolata rhizophorae]